MTTRQADFFLAPRVLPEGFRYAEEFLTAHEEQSLLEALAALPLQEASYKDWTAKRRVVSYGGRYDFTRNVLLPDDPVPQFLSGLRGKAAAWMGIAEAALEHALVAEYRPGTQLGWHRDVSAFELVVGVSLGGHARMRLRRYPHRTAARDRSIAVELARRSAYSLSGEARWGWQHAISPTKSLRYSVTFRTLRR